MLKKCFLLFGVFSLFTITGLAQENGWITLTVGQSSNAARVNLIPLSISYRNSGQTRITGARQRASTPKSQAGRGIRTVNFRNFSYQREAKSTSNGGLAIEAETITLRRGRNTVKGEFTSGEYGSEIESVKYVDFDGDEKEEAVVVINTSKEVAGAYWEQDYFVFAYRDSKPVQVFHEYRYKAGGIRLSGKSLIIEAPFWKEDDGHCCPSSTETTIYRWRGDGLIQVSRKLKRMR